MQTVMYDTLMTLVKVLTPIIPHTTDELWAVMGMEEASVQLTDFPAPVEHEVFTALRAKWENVIALRDEVLKALEEARNAKTIGKSLEAKVTVYADSDEAAILTSEGMNFAELCIVSDFVTVDKAQAPAEALATGKLAIVVTKLKVRNVALRQFLRTVGESEAHPTLCKRCADV